MLACRKIAFLGDSIMRTMGEQLVLWLNKDPGWWGHGNQQFVTPEKTDIRLFFVTQVRLQLFWLAQAGCTGAQVRTLCVVT